MLLDLDRKIVKLDTIWNRNLFSKILREQREKNKLSRKFVSDYLGKNKKQIIRYEDENETQLPYLTDIIKLCVLYQIQPNELLCFDYIDLEEHPEPGVIYRWEINTIKIE